MAPALYRNPFPWVVLFPPVSGLLDGSMKMDTIGPVGLQERSFQTFSPKKGRMMNLDQVLILHSSMEMTALTMPKVISHGVRKVKVKWRKMIKHP